MSSFDPQELNLQELVLRMFVRLRRSRFKLGVGEYMAALKAVEAGFGDDLDDLEDTLKLLWCGSLGEQSQFEPIWKSILAQVRAHKPRKPPFPGTLKVQPLPSPQELLDDRWEPEEMLPPLEKRVEQRPEPRDSLRMQAPNLLKPKMSSPPVQAFNLIIEEPWTLQAYYPISRRSLMYAWQNLRRPIADGPLNVLDINATIQQVSRQGLYISPVYARRERNDARLLLLVDQNGSMTPFHQFTRNLVETAREESSLDPENVGTFYFQNVPTSNVYMDTYLTEVVPLTAALSSCDAATSILIVSDAGAARGKRTRGRIRATARFLYQLKRYTSLIAWLNPMPKFRWVGSSAEIIANSVSMFQTDNEGLSNAIDVVRGQPLKHSYSSSL
ncbi:MAG: VWA domain-containing protein [Leptolyngbyaceae cyanobacterium MO_188.B28]|nr:VWA domain-containing protein [Leptolyngbyaceae cyanobacterium MO_188.B28]